MLWNFAYSFLSLLLVLPLYKINDVIINLLLHDNVCVGAYRMAWLGADHKYTLYVK